MTRLDLSSILNCNRKWTDSDKAELIAAWGERDKEQSPKVFDRDYAKEAGRSPPAIEQRRIKLGLVLTHTEANKFRGMAAAAQHGGRITAPNMGKKFPQPKKREDMTPEQRRQWLRAHDGGAWV